MNVTPTQDAFRVNHDLIAIHVSLPTAAEVVTHLAGLLVGLGYVKPSYTAAVLERERTCPTGLPTAGVGTAIPHAGIEHTLKPGIAIATLAQPVKFGQLGEPELLIDVSVVFMLSVTRPEAQVYLLQSLVNVYRDERLLRRIQAATEPVVVADEINLALAALT
jgi:galactitol PTS system EIIA component